MDKKKCLLIWGGQLNASGVPNVLLSLAEDLKDKVSFTLVAAQGENPKAEDFVRAGVDIRYIADKRALVNETSLFAKMLNRMWYYVFRILSLRKQIAAIITPDYDCVYCVCGPVSGVYLGVARKKGIGIRIVHCHGQVSRQVSRLRKIQLDVFDRLLKKNVTCKLTCSTEAGRTLFSDPAGMITLVNGIDLSQYSALPKTRSPRLRLLQIGYFNAVKNQQFSIRVLRELVAAGHDAALTFIGYAINSDGYYREMLSLIEHYSLQDRVTFLPPDADKNAVLADSDLLLLPSQTEACPLVALEAQATETPVCASVNVPIDIDFGLCEFVAGWDEKQWADRLVTMAQTAYSRKPEFCEIDRRCFADKIYRLMCGESIN